MTTLELRAGVFQNLNALLDDEDAMKQINDFLNRLRKQKATAKKEVALMSQEEFFAKIDRALQEADEGKAMAMKPNETLDEFLDRTSICIK